MRSRKPEIHPPLTAKVLIVDDDERNAFAARQALEVLGHEVVVARSGEEALRKVLVDEFAVILMDLHMPGMDGYETARLIRERPRTRDTPIVFLTAVFRDEAHVFQAYTAGAVDMVFKPVDPFILRSKVSILVDLYLKTMEVRRQADESQRLLKENARVSAEKEAAEAALSVSRRRQEMILGSLPIVFHSRNCKPPFAALFVSENVKDVTGFPASAFTEVPDFGFSRVHPEDRPVVEQAIAKAVETGAYTCEYRWLCADDAYRTFLDQGVMAPENSGDEPEVFGTLLDMTERRSLEEQLTQARKMEAVGQLTGGVAHDFNNLLTVVLGNADSMIRRVGEDARLKRQLSAILFAAERGQSLTNQLLAFSRRQQLKPAVVDINDLIRTFAPLIGQAVGDGVTIDLQLAEQSMRVNVDPNQLETALLNLAVNARDAMNREGCLTITTGPLRARKGAANRTRSVRVTVTDTGQGMSTAISQRIFEPFFTTKEVGKGSGLGLSQVYGFVSQSGGSVNVMSAPGKGTTFDLQLPLTTAAESPRPSPAAETALIGGAEHILVVEDDPDVLALCVDILTELGYRCTTATSASEAQRLLQSEHSFDLLFSDVVMPGGINGIQLANLAVETRPGLRVLLTSGYLGEEAVHQPHGFTVLDKPYQRQTLAMRLREVLEPPSGDVSRLVRSA
jgi:signal transduction histidine kinase/DNA-binding response OmpR family regulator